MSKYKPSDIITIKGTEFAVLDTEKRTAKDGKDRLFVLLEEPVGNTKFGATNDYEYSELRKEVDNWFKKYVVDVNEGLIYSRCVSLLTMDGHADYGTMTYLAAPLTFDEYRKYAQHIPDCEKDSWMTTGYGAPSCRGGLYALLVDSGGYWGSDHCSLSYAARPAMWVSEELIDKEPDLSKYTTAELLEELQKRDKTNG